MFKIDDKFDYQQIQQFASQIKHLPEAEKQLFEDHFTNQHSDDYYHGLLSGLAGAHQIVSSDISQQDAVTTIKFLLAFVADKAAQRGL